MKKIKLYLQLFRAQTAPATVFTLLVPYLIAGGRELWVIASLFILGHLAHFFSFGHNSLMDYWHDIHDPSKRHHPLIAGSIKMKEAHKVIHYGMILTAILLAAIIAAKNAFHALIPILLYIVFGHAYNDGLDHNTKHSWIPITLCFTSLATAGWILHGAPINIQLILIAAWAFLTIFYQIAYEGNLKDLWNPAEKYNPLKPHAIIYKQALVMIDGPINIFFMAVRGLINTLVLVILMALLSCNIISYILLAIFTVIEFIALRNLHFKRPIERDMLLSSMGLAEAIEFFRLISALGIIGIPLIAYGITYFISMNKILWGTKFGPKV